MNSRERGVVVDIGGGKGERAFRDAALQPEFMFYVIDRGAPRVDDPVPDNVQFIEQFVDFGRPLPFPDKSVAVARMFFLMGELESSGRRPSRMTDEKFLYKMISSEVFRVLDDHGVLQVMEVRDTLFSTTTVLYELGFAITRSPELAMRGSSFHADQFYELFEQSGKSPEESHTAPLYFEAQKAMMPGFHGF